MGGGGCLGGWGWVVGSAENRASSAPIELGLGLSLAIQLKLTIDNENLFCYAMLQFYRQNFMSKHNKAHKQAGAELCQGQQRQQLVCFSKHWQRMELNCYIFQCLNFKYLILISMKFDTQYIITMENSHITL